MGQPIADRNELVDLLLILDYRKLRLRVFEYVGHLLCNGVLIHGHRDGTEALNGGESGVQARTIVANNGHGITARQPELS